HSAWVVVCAKARRSVGGPPPPPRNRRLRLTHEGQTHGERRSLALAGTLGVNGAVMQGDQVAHDREAEAEATMRSRLGGVVLTEAVEDIGQELPTDAGAGIAHDD